MGEGGPHWGFRVIGETLQEAIKSGSKESVLSAAREVLMESWRLIHILK